MGKRILFIAPASFPANSAEAIVNLKQLKLLCDNGYKIDVISKKNEMGPISRRTIRTDTNKFE